MHESSMPNESKSLNSHQLSPSFGPGFRLCPFPYLRLEEPDELLLMVHISGFFIKHNCDFKRVLLFSLTGMLVY